MDRTLSLDQVVAEKAEVAAGRLCFEFATIGLEGRAGQWDAMMYDHPGRWGPRDIYRGVWAANRRRIQALYGLLPAPDILPLRPATAAGIDDLVLLPAGVWVLRGGKSRSDAVNADAIRAAFREQQGGVSMAPFNLAQPLPNREGADINEQRASLHRVGTRNTSYAPLGESGVRALDLLELLASTDVLVSTLTLTLTLNLTLAHTLTVTLTLTLTMRRCSSACSVPGCGTASSCVRAPCWSSSRRPTATAATRTAAASPTLTASPIIWLTCDASSLRCARVDPVAAVAASTATRAGGCAGYRSSCARRGASRRRALRRGAAPRQTNLNPNFYPNRSPNPTRSPTPNPNP